MAFVVIVTVGPSLLSNFETLQNIDALGDCIYRINGAHLTAEAFEEHVSYLRSALGSCSVMMDLPCNKIRTANLNTPINLERGQRCQIHSGQINYPGFFEHLQPGTIITAMDSFLRLEVIEVEKNRITLISHSDGVLRNNRGLHVKEAHQNLPYLFEKDLGLIGKALQLEVGYLSLSYVRCAEDIRQVKTLVPSGIRLIAKIETASAVKRLDEILDEIDIVNIDRGDLSSEIGLIELGAAQDQVIRKSLARKKQVFLATQFLKSMETRPLPLIAEVMDLYRTICTGISGIQLSEETAVGRYPTKCVKLVLDMYRSISENMEKDLDRG
jgi:pyruvate kinase